MVVLGIDYGSSHVGVAMGETFTGVAVPLRTFHGLPRLSLFEELRSLAQAHGAQKIIVGLPVSLDGREHGVTVGEVKEFISHLVSVVGLPAETIDERFTSDQAARLRQENSHADIHALSAMLIVQGYLERLPKE